MTLKIKKKSDNKDDDCCDGNCQHHSCHCSTFNFNQFLPFSTELRSFYSLITKEKRQLIFNETFLSTGFYSIWSPPNINY